MEPRPCGDGGGDRRRRRRRGAGGRGGGRRRRPARARRRGTRRRGRTAGGRAIRPPATAPVQRRPRRLRSVSSGGSGHEVDDLARAQRPVDAREHEPVGRGESDRVRAEPRIGGEHQLAVEIPEGLAHRRGVLSRRAASSRIWPVESRDAGSLASAGPRSRSPSSSNATVPPGRSRAAKRISRTCHPTASSRRAPSTRESPARTAPSGRLCASTSATARSRSAWLTSPWRTRTSPRCSPGDVAPALDDVPLADRQPAPLPAVGDVEVARAAGHVGLAQQPEQLGRARRTGGAFRGLGAASPA